MMPLRQNQHSKDGGTIHSRSKRSYSYTSEQSSLLSLSQPPSFLQQGQEIDPAILAKSRHLLYISHFFAQFSEVAWQFCLILFLAAFSNYESLILVSTYGFCSHGFVCVFGARCGRFVDGANRLFVAQRFILSENCCVLLASACCYVLLGRAQDYEASTKDTFDLDASHNLRAWLAHRFDGVPLDLLSIVLLVALHAFGSIAMILDKGFLVAMERDWIVVMSQYATSTTGTQSTPLEGDNVSNQEIQTQESKVWLSDTNVMMKQIDLGCKVAAPAVAGLLIASFDDGKDPHHGNDLRGAALVVGAINAVALVVEYICTKIIYQSLPELANKRTPPASSEIQQLEEPITNVCHCAISDSLKIYFEQTVAMGGVSLSLLYLNVLSFGGIMTAYLVWKGMGLEKVGVWRGVNSALGLLGIFCFSFSTKRFSLKNTGMIAIIWQFACLSLSYLSLFVDNYTLSLTLLIGGVISSRIGLWVFDVAVTQLFQQTVRSEVSGVVGGVQQSLNAFFFLLSFGLGFVFPDPKDFYIDVAAGYASVAIAMVLYATTVYSKHVESPTMAATK